MAVKQVEVNGQIYLLGDFVCVYGHTLEPGAKKIIRIDEIVHPHLSFACEYENGELLYAVNSLYIEGLATEEEILNEYSIRKRNFVQTTFAKQNGLLTFEWGKIDEIKSLKPLEKKAFPFVDGLCVYEENSQYCLSLSVDEPWHDGAMAYELGIPYLNYVTILKHFNGK